LTERHFILVSATTQQDGSYQTYMSKFLLPPCVVRMIAPLCPSEIQVSRRFGSLEDHWSLLFIDKLVY